MLLIFAVAMFLPVANQIQAQGNIPLICTHSPISALRAVFLERPNGGELRQQEKDAIHKIDDALPEIKDAASIDDGKGLADHSRLTGISPGLAAFTRPSKFSTLAAIAARKKTIPKLAASRCASSATLTKRTITSKKLSPSSTAASQIKKLPTGAVVKISRRS